MNVLVAKSWEGDREGDPERRVIILPNLGRGGSVDGGAMPWAAFLGLGRGSAKGDTSQGSLETLRSRRKTGESFLRTRVLVAALPPFRHFEPAGERGPPESFSTDSNKRR